MIKTHRLELDYLRVILCISIILIHLMTTYANQLADDNMFQVKLMYYVRNILIYGTPSFIILSQLIITLNYKSLSKDFIWARLKYIWVPYLTVGMFYSLSESIRQENDFKSQFLENVVWGHWHGYFIPVILQFALLSFCIYRSNVNIFANKWVLLLSLIIQFTFFALLSHNAPFESLFTQWYPFSENTFILGWIYYFFLGGYIGYHYDIIKMFLDKFIVIIVFLAGTSFILFVYYNNHDYWDVTSFSSPLIFYNTFMFLLLLGVCSHFKTFMLDTVKLISAFSFFIYLFHPIILDMIYGFTSIYAKYTIPFLFLSLLCTLGICIGVGILLRSCTISKYMIGIQPYKIK